MIALLSSLNMFFPINMADFLALDNPPDAKSISFDNDTHMYMEQEIDIARKDWQTAMLKPKETEGSGCGCVLSK